MSGKTAVIMIGGSIKGVFGHAAFLKVLEEHDIHPDIILGASAGSIIGSFYASGKSVEQIYHESITFDKKDYVDFVPWYKLIYQIIDSGKGLKGVLKGDKLESYLERQLGEKNAFSKLQIPLYVGVINLNTKRVELANEGKVSEWVRGSTSIPTVYYPKKIGDNYFIDGAIAADNLPYMLLEQEPSIKRIFICNFTSELRKMNSSFIEDRDWPLLEIINRTIDAVLYSVDDKKINNVPVYTVVPQISITLDFLNSTKEQRQIAYEQAVESCRAEFKGLKFK